MNRLARLFGALLAFAALSEGSVLADDLDRLFDEDQLEAEDNLDRLFDEEQFEAEDTLDRLFDEDQFDSEVNIEGVFDENQFPTMPSLETLLQQEELDEEFDALLDGLEPVPSLEAPIQQKQQQETLVPANLVAALQSGKEIILEIRDIGRCRGKDCAWFEGMHHGLRLPGGIVSGHPYKISYERRSFGDVLIWKGMSWTGQGRNAPIFWDERESAATGLGLEVIPFMGCSFLIKDRSTITRMTCIGMEYEIIGRVSY